MNIRVSLPMAAALIFAFGGSAGAQSQLLDSGLITSYSGGNTSIHFNVCGVVQGFTGCYGGGNLGPFEQACAVIEGNETQEGNVITRAIYVLDKRTSKKAHITLTVFTRTDTIANGSDTIGVMQTQQISLGLKGGTKAQCSMAANDAFVYAATSVDTVAEAIDKNSFAVTQVGGSDPPQKLKAITADERGYVSLQFDGSSTVFGPDGSSQQVSGGDAYMVGTRNAWKP
jgi:hypothetical protein